ncbi:hypothetical protein GCM10023082_19890 [Streptomyces tremellae]|uniref:Histidine kinase/HSP90-like ATPase domain-containing protein n=1 Tax=Streptomyces tremellae TaxID=1124239 RepID=A0ABP7EP24_9ACTN
MRIREHSAQQQRASRPLELSSPAALSDARPGARTDARPGALTHTYPRRPASVGAARRRVRAQLAEGGVPRELCDLAELVVSELVTNAVLRTEGSEVSCTARVYARGVRVEVRDAGPAAGMPAGHGMFLVDKVAGAWGAEPEPGGRGRTVWATVCLTDPARAGSVT